MRRSAEAGQRVRSKGSVRATLHRRAFLVSAAISGASTLFAPRLGRADIPYPLLAGKTVRILVGSDVGGNFDLFARSLGRHFEREIVGLRVEVQNIPQAGGALAAKTLQEGPTDGTLLMTSSSGLLGSQVQGEPVAHDLSTWSWLGSLSAESRLLIRGPSSDFSSFDQLRAKTAPSTLSVRSKSSFAYHEALWLNAMLGTRLKPIPGYKTVEKEVALVQGEVMLTVVGYPTDREILDSPGVDVVLRLTEGPELPDRFQSRPLLADLVAGDSSAKSIAAFMLASTSMLNWMAAPPATDPAVLAEWRRAFAAAASSPTYLVEAEKLGFSTSLTGGAELSEHIGAILADMASLRARLAEAHTCGAALADGSAAVCTML